MKKESSFYIITSIVFFSIISLVTNTTATTSTGLYPDLQTVVPTHLQLVNEHQREILRFSNGVANTGDGSWQMRPVFPLGASGTQDAIQEILDVDGNVVEETLVSQFEFHPEHHHWHIGDVALFTVHADAPDGVVLAGTSVKSTACLIDWYKLDDNSPNHERVYFDCIGEHQGISVGWVDQYHQSTEGQQIDITSAPPGLYYLVSKANPEGIFLEKGQGNNEAWTSFELIRDSNGNPKIKIIDHSECDSPGLCGERSTNR